MKPAFLAPTLAVLLLSFTAWAQQSLPLQQTSPKPVVQTVPFQNSSPGLELAPSFPSDKEVLPLIPERPEPFTAPEPAPGTERITRDQNTPIQEFKNRTEDAVRQLKQRIRYREIKARSMALPEVREPLEASRKARSDRELRSLLQKHYERLFDRMATAAPDLTPLIRQQRSLAMEPLSQAISTGKP